MNSFCAQVTTVAVQLHSVGTATDALVRQSLGAINSYVMHNTAGLMHRAVDALLGMLALVALVAAFAVEFAPISPDVQQAAHKLLHVGQTANSPV